MKAELWLERIDAHQEPTRTSLGSIGLGPNWMRVGIYVDEVRIRGGGEQEQILERVGSEPDDNINSAG